MELYSKELIKEIQNTINTNEYTITTFDSYDHTILGQRDILFSGFIRISFTVDANNHRDAMMVIHDATIGKKYLSEWKCTPAAKIIKDWKKQTKKDDGLIPYVIFTCKFGPNTKIKVLAREVIEYNEELSEDELKEIKKIYFNITANGIHYSIIKIWYADDLSETASEYRFEAHIEDSLRENIGDDGMLHIEEEDDSYTPQDIEDTSSETLF